MRLILHRTCAVNRMIVAGAALAMCLLPVFTPDARASEPRWYVGLNVPVMFIDNSDSVERGDSGDDPVHGERPDGIRYGVQGQWHVGL